MRSTQSNSATHPISFGFRVKAKNRMFFASMGFDLCDKSGFPKPEFLSIYKSLMDGGCGFGFIGNASVDEESHYNERGLKLASEAHMEALLPVFNTANDKRFPLGIQLQHYGPQGIPSNATTAIMSPSGISSPLLQKRFPSAQSLPMSDTQIQKVIEKFAYSAHLAQRAGASLIQLQASNGYLISSFLSPRTNRRKDRWGGSPLRRAEMLLAIIRRAKKATDGRATITVRLGIDDGFGDQGQQVELLGEVVSELEDAGVSAIECSVGVNETYKLFFEDKDAALKLLRHGCRYLKTFAKIPIGFTGSVANVEMANSIIESGDSDFVGFGRAVLADNNLVKKELNGLEHKVNRCRWDAQCFRDKREPKANRVYCCVNPDYLRPNYLQQLYKENPK